MKRYRVQWGDNQTLLSSNFEHVISRVRFLLLSGYTLNISEEEIADERSPVALHHIRKGCCDGTDPVACYAAQVEREQREHAEQMAQRRAEKARASSPRPWDEFDGTD